ncbi:aminoglycoside phosphotransferase family protein [Microbacterium sp. C7(2022)]|uniref:aminoglycoside phosphotransferase family protein n=1 Tax=Microbacterium sp. C7(2022) TaxID=2992759 RepID=UPI00237A786E|nr:aminoglycoside phosphotransferase family protein [Microbacterium sp. C7(2022)]MDE0545605.1 aminoglycoside phosphotransferase family protein [Microbacterium sp. C7(2022)]
MPNRPHAEVAIDEALVRSLLVAQGGLVVTDAATAHLSRASSGWDNEMWRVGDRLAVRLPRRARAAPLIHHEHAALPEIAIALQAAGVEVPVPLVRGEPSADFPWPWSVVPWSEGCRAMDLPRGTRSSWAASLAQALLALHHVAPDDAPQNVFRGPPLDTRDGDVTRRIQELHASGALSRATARAVRGVWRAGIDAPTWPHPPVWIHGDLHPGNLITSHGTLAAIIDFGDVTAGDPAYDLAVAWLTFDAAGRDHFWRALGNGYDPCIETRARAWAAVICVMLLTHSDDNPDYAALGAEALGEVLA